MAFTTQARLKVNAAVETVNNQIQHISGWGAAPGAPEVVRFLQGPQKMLAKRRFDLTYGPRVKRRWILGEAHRR